MAAIQEDEVLISMKRPKRAVRESMPMVAENNPYGYGLTIRLENFELDALKMKLPVVGQVFEIEAKAIVTAVSESQSSGNKGDRSATIQITDLCLGPTLDSD
jgi:hypothetical protein